MEDTTINGLTTIKVDDIIYQSDRTYGGDGDIETLARSIEEHDLIQPIAVKMLENGKYKIVAGRRRLAAVKRLGWDSIIATVYASDVNDEEIALAENTNRLDMHPLDEAAAFKKMRDAVQSVEDIAKYYCRSVAAIYHRIRLNNLIDPLKTMFRDGRFKLVDASVLAGFTKEMQEQFFKRFENSVSIYQWDINGFIKRFCDYKVCYVKDNGCAQCSKRTFCRTDRPELFEDYKNSGIDDLCLDVECWNAKARKIICKGIIKIKDEFPESENLVFFDDVMKDFFVDKKSKQAADFVFGNNVLQHPENAGKYVLIPEDYEEEYEEEYIDKIRDESFLAYYVSENSAGRITVSCESFYLPPEKENEYESDCGFEKVLDITDKAEIKAIDNALVETFGSGFDAKYNVRKKTLQEVMKRRIKKAPGSNAGIHAWQAAMGTPMRKELFKAITGKESDGELLDYMRNLTVEQRLLCLDILSFNLPDVWLLETGGLTAEERGELDKSELLKFAGISTDEFVEIEKGVIRKTIESARAGKGGKEPEAGGDEPDEDAETEVYDEDDLKAEFPENEADADEFA